MKFDVFRKLKGDIKKYSIVSFDVETYLDDNKFLICGVYDDEYKVFFNKQDAINYLLNNHTKNKLYVSTNLVFDIVSLFYETEYLSNEYMRFSFSKTRLISVKFSYKKKVLKFIDTLNFINASVEKLGEIISLRKLEKPKCLGKKINTKKDLDELIKYNERDCLITKRIIEYIQDYYNKLGAELKMTISSTCLNLFRRKYLKKNIVKKDFIYKDKIFSAYYGGRTEAFARGKIKNMYLYDINSMYPYVMLNKFPNPESVRYLKNSNISIIQKYDGVSKVLVSVDENKYMLLPYKHNSKLIFPYGRFKGYYTHIELREAIKNGYKILKVYESVYYIKKFAYFKDYVKDFYKRRLLHKDNFLLYNLDKLSLNSLYGKFGSREISSFRIYNLKNINYSKINNDGLIINNFMNIGYSTNKRECFEEYVIPIFPVYITAYGRILLYRAIKKYNAIYCDTDSIITDKIIKHSNKLGKFKLEAVIKEGVIIKPKSYFIKTDKKDIIKLKGFPKATIETFKKILKNNKIEIKKILKLREAIRRKLKPNATIKFKKYMTLDDDKREWKNKFNHKIFDDNSKPLKINDF